MLAVLGAATAAGPQSPATSDPSAPLLRGGAPRTVTSSWPAPAPLASHAGNAIQHRGADNPEPTSPTDTDEDGPGWHPDQDLPGVSVRRGPEPREYLEGGAFQGRASRGARHGRTGVALASQPIRRWRMNTTRKPLRGPPTPPPGHQEVTPPRAPYREGPSSRGRRGRNVLLHDGRAPWTFCDALPHGIEYGSRLERRLAPPGIPRWPTPPLGRVRDPQSSSTRCTTSSACRSA